MNLDVDGFINNKRKEIILCDNLVRNDVDWQAHILEGGERSIEVEVLDVRCRKGSVGGGDSAVEKSFDGLEIRCGSTFISNVFDAIAADSKAHTVSLCFCWAYCSHNTTVGYCAILGNIVS